MVQNRHSRRCVAYLHRRSRQYSRSVDVTPKSKPTAYFRRWRISGTPSVTAFSNHQKNALIGMGTTILDGAEIGENAFIGAGSLIPPGKKIPPNTLAFGRPAKVIRELNDEDYQELERVRETYIEKGQVYKKLQDQGDTP